MKMQATSRNEARSQSAECTGFLEKTTASAVPSASAAKMTNSQPTAPVSSALSVISALLHHGKRLHVGSLLPVRELSDVEVQRLVAVVSRHLVGLRRQPDRLGHRGARFLAELAEHAALQIDVEPVEHLHRLGGLVLLVVPVDVNDVDRALDRAERALDAPLLVETEHPAEAVGRDLLLLRVLDRHLLFEEMTPRHSETVEEVEERDLVEPFLESHG